MTEQFQVGNFLLVKDGTTVRATTLVTEQQGSWKWQDAFRQAWYEIRYSPRQKKHFFEVVQRSGKFAKTRGRGEGLPQGSLHNRPVPAEVLAAHGTLLGEEVQ